MLYTHWKLCLLTYVSIIPHSALFSSFIEITRILYSLHFQIKEKKKYKHIHKGIWNLHKRHANLATCVRMCVPEFRARAPARIHVFPFILNLMCTLLQAELARLFTHLHYGRFNIVHLSQIASKRYTPNGYYAWKVFNHNMYRMSFEAKLNQKVENHKCNECFE